MASKKCLSILPLLLLVLSNMQCCVNGGDPQVPCLFVFGDSLSDPGNNNNLATLSKVKYRPYGIDFPTGSTGRFTNGETSLDIISKLLGFENYIPPFLNHRGLDILKGVNYASGAAGIRVETGKHAGVNVNLGLQIDNHRIIVAEIALKLGGFQQALHHLSQCLYYVNIGSNDFIANYFLHDLYPTSLIYSPESYAENLVRQFSGHIQALHDVGARKYAVLGVGAVGCTPYAISQFGSKTSCVEQQNADADLYDVKLKSQVDQFNTQFSDSKFIFINTTAETAGHGDMGFKFNTTPCCPIIKNVGVCIPLQAPCENRSEYSFWDAFHPTTALNQIVGKSRYNQILPLVQTQIQPTVQTQQIRSHPKFLKNPLGNMNKLS